MYHKILSLLKPPDFGDEEKNRVAEILNVIALSILAGFTTLVLQRAASRFWFSRNRGGFPQACRNYGTWR